MNGIGSSGKMLMFFGAIIFLAGLALYISPRFGFTPPFGRMPGDISYSGRNFKVFVPITSMIIVSLLLTLILNILSRFFK